MESIQLSIQYITKPLYMRPIIIISILVLITYALAQGIHIGSIMGIIFATCSLLALGVAIYLTEKLKKQEAEEAENEYQ